MPTIPRRLVLPPGVEANALRGVPLGTPPKSSAYSRRLLTLSGQPVAEFVSTPIFRDGALPAMYIASTASGQRVFNTLPTTGTWTTGSFNTIPGSAVLIGVSRGTWSSASPAAPSDSLGNTLTLQNSITPYAGFPTSEVGHYLATGGIGGMDIANAAFGAGSAGNGDEITLAAIEIVGVNTVQNSNISETASGATLSLPTVTTTGPAILIAFVWGNGNAGQDHTYTSVDRLWQKLPSASRETDFDPLGYIQLSVFSRVVTGSGTYGGTIAGVASEGALMAVFALQNTGSTAYTAGVSETVTLSEAIAISMGALVGINETVNLSESLTSILSAIAIIAETVNLSESESSFLAATLGVSETVTLSEAIGIVAALIASAMTETVTLSEVLAAGLLLTASLTETVTLSESLTSAAAFISSLTESVSLSESLAIIANFIVSSGETVTLSESIAAGLLLTASISETVTLSESLSAVFHAIVATPETVNLSESLSTLAAFISSLTDTLALSESLSGGIQLIASISETVNISEVLAASRGTTGAVNETVSLSESLTSLAAFISSLTNTLTLSESLVGGLQLLASVAETVAVTEAVGVSRGTTGVAAETVSLSEALQSSAAYTSALASVVALTEQLIAGLAQTASVAENVTLSEAVSGSINTLLIILADITKTYSNVLSVQEPVTSISTKYVSSVSANEPTTRILAVEPVSEMTMSLDIKAGDRYPSFSATLVSSIDFNLADATAVTLVWRHGAIGTRHSGLMTIVDAPTKKVSYAWGPSDTLVPGVYEAEVELTFSGGLVMTIPNKGFYTFTIGETI